MYFKSEEVLMAWKASAGGTLIFRLKPQYSHILCIVDCEWINLGSWGMWLEMQEATLQTFSGLKWKRMALSWTAFFLLFPMSKKGDYSYQWRLSVKHHYWIREIRPSVFKRPFHKAHCTYVLFWKEFPTLIPSSDIKICAEPLLLGLETFEASSGTDTHYSCLRRWLWHNSFFWELGFYKEKF